MTNFRKISVPLDVVIDALADASLKENGSLTAAQTVGSAAGIIAADLVNTNQIEFGDAFLIITKLLAKRQEKRGEPTADANT